jgi:glucokinase
MYVGLHVGKSQIEIGLVSDRGDVSFPSTFPVEPDADSERVIIDIIYNIKTVSEEVPIELFNNHLTGIGITIDGVLDEENEQIVECVNRNLINIRLRERLQRNFDIDVFVRSSEDAKTLASKEIAAKTGRQAEIAAAGLLCKYIELKEPTIPYPG